MVFLVPLQINFISSIVLCLDLYLLLTEFVSTEDVSFISLIFVLIKC